MISGRSCDTEDWSNLWRKFSFDITEINYIFKYIKLVILNCNNISQYYCIILNKQETSFKNTDPKLLICSIQKWLLCICFKTKTKLLEFLIGLVYFHKPTFQNRPKFVNASHTQTVQSLVRMLLFVLRFSYWQLQNSNWKWGLSWIL